MDKGRVAKGRLGKYRLNMHWVGKKEDPDGGLSKLADALFCLEADWREEYKPLLKKIWSATDEYERVRLASLSTTTCSDDFDEIEVDATIAAVRRENKRRKIVRDFHCQFIIRICVEVDRQTLLFMKRLGYSKDVFSVRQFVTFSQGLRGEGNPALFKSLRSYDAYDLLHLANNFLKHNSRHAYDVLYERYRKNVLPPAGVDAKIRYESGMYAGDWLVFEEGYIDGLFAKLIVFFEDYGRVFLKTNQCDGRVDSDVL